MSTNVQSDWIQELHPSELQLLRRCERMLRNAKQRIQRTREERYRILTAEEEARKRGLPPYGTPPRLAVSFDRPRVLGSVRI
jgi:hypothetical protein